MTSTPLPHGVGNILNKHELSVRRASVENARVSVVGKALSWQGLAVLGKGRELVIVTFILVFAITVEDGHYEVPFAAAGFGKRLAPRQGAALEHEGAILADDAGVFWGEDAVRDGGGEFGEEAVDMRVVDRTAGDGFQFADEIGGAKSAARGVGMGVAEAVSLRVRGEGAAASIGKGEAAAGGGAVQIGGVGGEPFGGLRVDISGKHHRRPNTGPRRMSKALASHGESIAKGNSIDK
jgi:hypothetical protein